MADEMKEELELMNKSLNEGLGEEPVVEKEELPKEEPKVEEPKVEPTPEPKEEPKVEPEPKVEEPKVEPVVEDKDKIIADLRAKVAEKEVAKPKEPEKKEPPKEEPLKFEEQDFIGDLDIDDLTRDSKKLNEVLNKIYQKSVTDTRRILGESVIRSIPEIVSHNIEIQEGLRKMNTEFYEENKDLKPFNKVVAVVFEEMAAASPDKTMNDVLKEVAPEVRKRLELHKKAVVEDPKPKKDDPPKLPQKGGRAGRTSDKPNTSPLQSEIEEMNKTLRS